MNILPFLYFKLETITKVMLRSSISSGLDFCSLNHTSIYENSKSNVLKNIKVLGEISSNRPNNLLGTNTCRSLES